MLLYLPDRERFREIINDCANDGVFSVKTSNSQEKRGEEHMKITDCLDIVGERPKRFPGTKRYVSTGALEIDHIHENSVENVTYDDRPSRADLIAFPGDVLFAKMAETKKTLLVDEMTAHNIYSTGFLAVRAKEEIILPKCLYFLLTSDVFLKQKDKNASGATQRAITNKGLEGIHIKVPAFNTQKTLIRKLEILEIIIKKRRKQLSELDNLTKARFVEMFGDPVSNSKGWEIVPLGKRCEIVTGNTPSRAESENYGEYIEWIKSDNINTPFTFITKAQEYLSETGFKKCRFVEAGSLLMTCIAGSINCIGNVAVTNRRVAFNQQINAIVPEQDEVLYLYWLMLLSKPAIHSTINMALKGILSKGKLSELTFPFPPIELQRDFVAFVEQTDKSKSVIQKSLKETQLLFDSLMQEYFG